jgi:hypothetical protein
VVLAHRAAYVLRHGHIPQGVLVRHSCDTPSCVEPCHLLAGDQGQNRQDWVQRHPRRAIATWVRAQFAKGESVTNLAAALGLSQGIVIDILDNKTFTDSQYRPPPYDSRDPRRRKTTKLDRRLVDHAKRQRAAGRTIRSIAEELEVSYSTAWEALNGRKKRPG